ncbi:MAG: hypothetical protein DWQ01_12010 [Planctomycetota bacterium]|nr:MAG: hypothetical protein DWQ01_12010 [Planctomycetota bacterium]
MLRTSLLLSLLAFGFGRQEPLPPLKPVLESITIEECESLVQVLAGPAMMGRATPSAGLDKAAAFVEEQLQSLGLEPAGPDGSYRLPYDLPCLVPAEGTAMSWAFPGKEAATLKVGADFVPIAGSKEASARGEAVFAGFAIQAPKERWKDLDPRKIRDKVVFAFTGEPRENDPKFRGFEGADPSKYGSILHKIQAVAEAGAAALVLVPDPHRYPEHDGPMDGVAPYGLREGIRAEQISRISRWPKIPVFSASRKVASEIFGTDMEAHFASLNKKKKSKLLEPKKMVEVALSAAWEGKNLSYYNLAARLPGTDGDGEVVILGAHLDHVGNNLGPAIFGMGSQAIHPGADDNASGSAALLETAQALASLKPKEDILFLWFTGEEIGLRGSMAYCRDPLYPHDKTIGMLNMDMVGRGDRKKMNIGGLWSRPEWAKLVKAQAKRAKIRLKLDLNQGRDLYARSDQYAFHRQDVPALFFFEADLNDNKVYHQPGDVPETIDARKMTEITKLFTATAFALAVEGERPAR